ncbi:type V toxin-antitoxin system endoribonuclease antitoxin GhoS [Roseateles chitinivorans]|uniref:type V toxin-antitoxin system endoribonuclease antitoxin GhoS n=1 Tax=Roseateles chitinivorans TaxID=2917965 RepID=UPI003D67FAA7
MARYTVRIELHSATWDHYKKLYEHMARAGFADILTSDDGVKYKMPPGEYNIETSDTREKILASAKACAGRVASKYAVLVTQSAGRSWDGLDRV